MSDLGERLRASLSAYYEWVEATEGEDGKVQLRVGKDNPTEDDVTQFLLRVKEEMDNGQGVIELDIDTKEISSTISPIALPTAEEDSTGFLKRLKDFGGAVSVVEDEKLDLSRFFDLKVKTAFVSVPCAGFVEARRNADVIKKFLEQNGFQRVQEESTEDTYVSHNGMLARANFFATPGIQPILRLAIHLPKTVTEANLIRKHFGLDEVEFVRPDLRKVASEAWESMDAVAREAFLQKKAGIKVEGASKWAVRSFDEILDVYPVLAQILSKELRAARV